MKYLLATIAFFYQFYLCAQCIVVAPVPDDSCYQVVIANDSFCCDTGWDGICQDAYDECQNNGGTNPGTSGCNSDVSICTSGVAGPFIFDQTTPGPPTDYAEPVGCSTGMFGNDFGFGFIILYITQSGPLNLLVDGDSDNGFIDVVIYNIPNGVTPCDAVLNSNNEIGCNYATDVVGCTQFGTDFPCPSSIPAPIVTAGQRIMIIVHDYSTESTSFTLELGPTGSQTGLPDATLTAVPPICVDSAAVQLQSSSLGGTWSGNGVTPEGIFDPAIAGVGTHMISYSIGTSPCIDSDSMEIEVLDCSLVPCEVDIIDVTPKCMGQTFDLNAVFNATAYSWTGPNNFSSFLPNPTQIQMPLIVGDYKIYLTATIGNQNCTDSTVLTVLPIPFIHAGNDVFLCADQELLLNATGNGVISWSNGIPNNSSFFPPVGQTTLIATITDSSSCVSTDTLVVAVIDNFPVSFIADTTEGCSPISVEFQNTSMLGMENNWYINDVLVKQNVDTLKYVFNEATCYDVRLEIKLGDCVSFVEHDSLICDFAIPTANFEFYENIYSLEEVKLFFQNTSSNSSIYSWDFGDNSFYDSTLSPNHLYDVSNITFFTIELMSSNEFGCIDSISRDYIFNPPVNYFVPNTFTPNGDEFNNTFLPIFTNGELISNYKFSIYNKWGELIFESHDLSVGWDGSYHHSIVQYGTYNWVIEYQINNKTPEVKKINGFMNLMR